MFLGSWRVALRDDLTLPLGASHVATIGVEAERFRVRRGGVLGAYGAWGFASLDSLADGVADRFEVRRDFGSAAVPIAGGQYAVYAGDRWRAGEHVAVTAGVRADLLAVDGRPPYNATVDSVFGRRTDAMPRRRVHLSPRLGFTWDLAGTGRDRLRGGVGLFAVRPPLAWMHSALAGYGVGAGVLRCGRQPTDRGLPPSFAPDPLAPPATCAGGAGLAGVPPGDVDLLDPALRMAQTLRASLAYERRLPGSLLGTLEALVTRSRSDFVFVNLNLVGPQTVDAHGRVLYGAIGRSGAATPALRSSFSEVVDLRNVAGTRSVQLSGRLERRFSRGAGAAASYTWSRVRDVQTPLRVNTAGLLNWSSRAESGRHDDLRPGVSSYDVPHRVVLAGTFTAPWRRWPTDVSLYYVGESGAPFTYRARGARGRGDLNADGSNANDPIYVPASAFDTAEIRFAGGIETPGADDSAEARAERARAQQAAFEQRIRGEPCLRRQRGRILARNSCREPWSHTTLASVRQGVRVGRHALGVELDAFNVLNLLRRDWGRYRVASPGLLEHVGHTAAEQPVFRFDAAAPRWTTLPTESAFQLQAGVRYRF